MAAAKKSTRMSTVTPFHPEQSQRLDRIESKIDKLAETVVQMARVEEKLLSLESDKKVIFTKLLRLEEQVEIHDRKIEDSAITVKAINRLFWLIVTALVGTVAWTQMFHK